ncbi:hypothetical protein [Haloarchaeobius sp. DYHT-AS-18]|uniref:hypothetical protein n=1 Tax=Haloarchaeobius sp. DYHT-AS-18 TaxID=3446117 RepID=UPI003EB91E84
MRVSRAKLVVLGLALLGWGALFLVAQRHPGSSAAILEASFVVATVMGLSHYIVRLRDGPTDR